MIGSSNETKCIRKIQICDGTRDCYYGEDEKYCHFVHVEKILTMVNYKKEMKEFWCCNGKIFNLLHLLELFPLNIIKNVLNGIRSVTQR